MARTAILLAGALAVASMGVVAVRAQGPTTTDGIYTAAQAAKGKELFGQTCESCHNPGKFAGAEFARAYGSKPLSEIDAGMSEMPMDNPGSLKREDVASLIAYFLEMNKYPAGQKALSGEADALKAIMVAPRP
ncbi:MAG: c-type cytochrome [Acidobacteria bacterium]|nr:c-type cytochrome [Acidobacteriota bacterium]